jgi:hypothetical protein
VRRHPKAIVAISALLLSTLVLGVTFASATAPVVSIDPPSSVSYTTAHVSGKVDPQDEETYYYFEYTQDPEEGWMNGEFLGPIAAGAGETAVSDNLTGLKPGTEYVVRLGATNFSEESFSAGPNPSFTTKTVTPPSVSIGPPSSITGTSAHFAGEINPEAPAGNPAAFDVNWHFECTPECPAVSGGTIPADSTGHQVSADATGLEPHTAYEVTLIAENAGAPASAGPESFTTEPVAPVVQTLYAGSLAAHSAVLNANVNPRNSVTSYQFEWGTDASYGNVVPTTPQELEATDGSLHLVSAPLGGLAEAATYHFRVVATNTETEQVTFGEDHIFRTAAPAAQPACANAAIRQEQGLASLSDCRAYEMITPPDAPNKSLGAGGRVSTDGNRFAFRPLAPLPNSTNGQFILNTYIGNRSAEGWGLEEISAVGRGEMPPTLRGYNPDTNTGVLERGGGFGIGSTIWLHNADGSATQIANFTPPPNQQPGLNILGFGGNTSDLSHVLVKTRNALVAGVPTTLIQLYDWTGGQFQLVSRLPNGEPQNFGVAMVGNALGGDAHQPEAISSDGRRIVFQLDGAPPELNDVYVRQDDLETIIASESQRSTPDPNGPGPAIYMGSSEDGNKVLFTSTEELTDDAQTEGDTVAELYEYEIDSGTLHTITPGFAGAANVSGVVMNSTDASTVYFTARAAIPGSDAIAGSRNLYVYHEEDDSVSFIATLREGDYSGIDVPGPFKQAAWTDDGRVLVFATRTSLTGDFNVDGVGDPQPEFYRYDDSSGELRCVSCGPAGTHATGLAALTNGYVLGLAEGQVGGDPLELGRNLSTDGDRFFFDSPDSLVPQDVNGRMDVYEFDAASGTLHLISPGNGAHDAVFQGSSASGDDVMIGTDQSLLGRDADQMPDVYDARVGGGFAEPPPGPHPCEGEACQGPPSTAPAAGVAGTAGFAGPGNSAHRKSHRVRATAPRKPVGLGSAGIVVRTPGAGEIRVGGDGIRPLRRQATHAGAHRLGLELTAAAKRSLRAKGTLRLTVRVAFAPTSGRGSSTSVALTIKTEQGSH